MHVLPIGAVGLMQRAALGYFRASARGVAPQAQSNAVDFRAVAIHPIGAVRQNVFVGVGVGIKGLEQAVPLAQRNLKVNFRESVIVPHIVVGCLHSALLQHEVHQCGHVAHVERVVGIEVRRFKIKNLPRLS